MLLLPERLVAQEVLAGRQQISLAAPAATEAAAALVLQAEPLLFPATKSFSIR